MQLILTERMQDSVKEALKKPRFPVKHKDEAESIADHDLQTSKQPFPISIDLIQQMSKCLDSVFLHELMKGTAVYIKPKEEKPKNPDFEAYMDKLRQEQQEREYRAMVSSVITSKDQKFNLGIRPDELKEAKSHIATIFNILFSMVAVYVAVYKASKSMFSDVGLQVLMGMGGAFFIGTVEVVLYTKYVYTATTEKKLKKSKKIATL